MPSQNKVATLQQKSGAWNKAGKSGADPQFLWRQHNGVSVSLHEMSTPHVWNALKIAWQKRHSMQGHGMKNYWKQAIANLYLELASRPNITNGMKATMKVIAKRITKR